MIARDLDGMSQDGSEDLRFEEDLDESAGERF